MDGFQKVLFGMVLWIFLAFGLIGFGIFAAIKFDAWIRKTAIVVVAAGTIVLLATLGHTLKLFEPCYAWFKY